MFEFGLSHLISGAVGALGALASESFLKHGKRLFARNSRAWPVSIHIEDDLEVIFANFPPWIYAPTFIPGIKSLNELAPPSTHPLELAMWARRERGGIPALCSTLELTVRSKSSVEVVVDKVSVHAEVFDPGKGLIVAQPVGGASVEFMRFEIELDEQVSWAQAVKPGGERTLEHVHTVKRDDPLRLHLDARFQNDESGPSGLKWYLELHLLVEGKRKTIRVPRKKDEFMYLVNMRSYESTFYTESRT